MDDNELPFLGFEIILVGVGTKVLLSGHSIIGGLMLLIGLAAVGISSGFLLDEGNVFSLTTMVIGALTAYICGSIILFSDEGMLIYCDHPFLGWVSVLAGAIPMYLLCIGLAVDAQNKVLRVSSQILRVVLPVAAVISFFCMVGPGHAHDRVFFFGRRIFFSIMGLYIISCLCGIFDVYKKTIGIPKAQEKFFSAIAQNDVLAVSYSIKKGVDVNRQVSGGSTPLMSAVLKNNKDIVQLLLDKGADVNCRDSEDQTPLFRAIQNGEKDIAQLLLDKGAAVNYKSSCGATPLTCAVAENDKVMVSLLLENGADVNKEDSDKHSEGHSPLFRAVQNGDKDIILLLLEKGADINRKDSSGGRPLMYAVVNSNKEMVSFLLEKGADVNEEDSYGFTPLIYAAQNKKNNAKDIASLLLEKGADINRKVSDGVTPLMSAVVNNNEEMVSFLLEKGADVTCKDSKGQTLLFLAAAQDFRGIAALLLKKGADANCENSGGGTPLSGAIAGAITKNNSVGMISLLLAKGADVNKRSDGTMPLFLPIYRCRKDIVALLLRWGADTNVRLSSRNRIAVANDTPLKLAFDCAFSVMSPLKDTEKDDEKEIFSLLLENGADINYEDNEGMTLLQVAALSWSEESVLFLISKGANVNSESSKLTGDNVPKTPLEAAIVGDRANIVSLLITYGADVNYVAENGSTPLQFAAKCGKTHIVPILKEAGATMQGTAQTPHTGASARSDSGQNDAGTFTAAVSSLSKIIAKHGVEILASENSQKFGGLVADFFPYGNEFQSKLRKALSCDFTQLLLDAADKDESVQETAFTEAVQKIAGEAKMEKDDASLIVKLVAVSLGWNLGV